MLTEVYPPKKKEEEKKITFPLVKKARECRLILQEYGSATIHPLNLNVNPARTFHKLFPYT